MAAQLQIIVRDVPHSDALEARIRRNLASIERICPRITAFHVTLEVPVHRHRQGGQFQVKLDVRLPGCEIVVTRDHNEDVYAALRDACHAARRQLVEHLERAQGADKAHRREKADSALQERAGDE